MCGVVGYIGKTDEGFKNKIHEALRVLKLRGPDASGTWSDENIGLAHTRLAIQDVSDFGSQPMHSISGRYVIVFNGEIYNHLELRKKILGVNWRGRSDTETLLEAYAYWGEECLQLLHGMFAFAIWDQQKKELFLARDRMGEKPLYYHHSSDKFVFASRPKALSPFVDLNDDFDVQGIRYYLQCGYFPGETSVFKDVKKLPPAHWMKVCNGEVTVERYWDYRAIPVNVDMKSRKEEDLLDELDILIQKSVSSRMLSDVPLGAFLSGGIDSSLVVAYMSRLSNKPINTFTIGFHEKDYDESLHAQAVADHLGTKHHCQHLNVDDLLELIPHFTSEYDEPFFDSSAFPTMAVSRLARKHVTVSLSGDGGDELFGGYHYYRIAEQVAPFFSMPKNMRGLIAAFASYLPSHKAKLLAGALRQPNSAAAFAFARSIAKDFGGLLTPEALEGTEDMHALFSRAALVFPENLTAGERGARLDAFYTLPDDYLQKVDMGSMAYSLESREPLLDHSLVEWAMRLPWEWKMKGNVNKYLLRKLAYRYIPRSILDRPKQGFGVPIDHWLRGPLHDWAQDLLHSKSLFDLLPISQKRANELFQLHLTGSRNVSALLWALLMLLNFVEKRNCRNNV